ncbi:immunity protein Imm1 of predicted polymorphic toxin system [Saccharothrix carnea]|uniref:Immunity protein Imm1 of predicted polymorphic toxin system n=2 Tax=Saccharothrix carnea TaxID=1280637 RepID=A0A2P8I7T9_SACCR|nr:immunity protein Imm1 of predicted polymorphic toxin system [Saccharothrix carnea]
MMPAMSFTAVWPITDEQDADAADEMTVDSPEDVDTLLRRLAEPGAGPAVIEHQDRPLITDTEGLLGAPGTTKIPDHDVAAAIHRGYGYLTYADPDHDYSTLAGDPASPEYRSEYVDYPAGAGVAVEVLADALKEFLATGERPTGVTWQAA